MYSWHDSFGGKLLIRASGTSTPLFILIGAALHLVAINGIHSQCQEIHLPWKGSPLVAIGHEHTIFISDMSSVILKVGVLFVKGQCEHTLNKEKTHSPMISLEYETSQGKFSTPPILCGSLWDDICYYS